MSSNGSDSLVIKPIQLPQDRARFIKAWWPICEDDPHWVPPIISERKQFFHPGKNPYFERARVQCFMAYRGGACVGTISAQVDEGLLEHEPGVGLFGFYEFVDDERVAKQLASAAMGWLSGQGMKVARGPYNFNSNHEFGALVDGFDSDPCVANPTNKPYYDRLYQAAGFRKAKDWYAYWIDGAGPYERMNAIGQRLLAKRPDIRLEMGQLSNWKQAMNWIYEIYNDAWSAQWSHAKLTRRETRQYADQLRPLLEEQLVWFAFVNDEPAGVALSVPDWNPVVKTMNGRLFPKGWYQFLSGRKKITAMRVWMLGIKQKYQHIPLGAPLYARTWEGGRSLGYTGAEASLILEDNHKMRRALEKMDAKIYKTYRIYECSL